MTESRGQPPYTKNPATKSHVTKNPVRGNAGRPDLHPNPLTVMRKSMRLSQEQTARRAGVTRQLVIRAEQAVYSDPPPALLRFLVECVDPANEDLRTLTGAPYDDAPNSGAVGVLDIDESLVYHQYHNFQKHVRRSSYGKLRPEFDFTSLAPDVHPWIEWRMQSGITARIGPAKFFCLHPALLHKFEVQPHLIQSPPGDLVNALLMSGYSRETLADLDRAWSNYKDHLRREFLRMQQ